MRKLTILVAAGLGAWAGWRAARSGVAAVLFPTGKGQGRDASIPTSSGSDRSGEGWRFKELSPSPSEVAEKLRALFELGRERGLEVFQSVLGGRTGHAA